MWGFVFEGSWGLRSADSIAALGSHGCQVSNLISIDLRFPWKLGTTRFLRDAINSCFSKLLSSFGEACYWTIYRWLPVSVFERLRFFGALFGFYWDVGDTICCIVYVRYVLRHDIWFRLVICCSYTGFKQLDPAHTTFHESKHNSIWWLVQRVIFIAFPLNS